MNAPAMNLHSGREEAAKELLGKGGHADTEGEIQLTPSIVFSTLAQRVPGNIVSAAKSTPRLLANPVYLLSLIPLILWWRRGKKINSLHFLLNIDMFFVRVKNKAIVSGRQNATLKREFDPLHFVVMHLSKLQIFHPRGRTSLLPSCLDWTFLKGSIRLSQALFSRHTCIVYFSFCLLLHYFL